MTLHEDRSMEFAVRIVKLSRYLSEKKEFVLATQILKSGTSIGANISEAKYAESTTDFIHKLSIAQKECSETSFWLKLLCKSETLTQIEFESIHAECEELLRLLTSSIKTLKQKNSQPKNK